MLLKLDDYSVDDVFYRQDAKKQSNPLADGKKMN